MNSRIVRQLRNNATLRLLPGGGELAVTSRAGTFHVTQERDGEDHVLEAGGEFHTRRRGVVVILAMSDGAVEVEDGAGQGGSGDDLTPPPSSPRAA